MPEPSTLATYRVTFDHIGRHRNVPPLDTVAGSASTLAARVLTYARPRLYSEQVEVHVDLDRMSGHILVGWVRPAGSFTIDVVEPTSQPAGEVAGATAP